MSCNIARFFHFSLETEFNALRFIDYTIPRLCSTNAVAAIEKNLAGAGLILGVKLLIFEFLGGLVNSIILIWLTHRFSILRFYLTLFDMGFFEPSVIGGGVGELGVRVTDQNVSCFLCLYIKII